MGVCARLRRAGERVHRDACGGRVHVLSVRELSVLWHRHGRSPWLLLCIVRADVQADHAIAGADASTGPDRPSQQQRTYVVAPKDVVSNGCCSRSTYVLCNTC